MDYLRQGEVRQYLIAWCLFSDMSLLEAMLIFFMVPSEILIEM